MAGLSVRGQAKRGRQRTTGHPVHTCTDGAYSFGCEIGWRHVEIILRNIGGEVLGHHRRDYGHPDARILFDEIGAWTRRMTGLVPEERRARIIGVGVAMPGGIARNIDIVGGSIEDANAWRDLDARQSLSESTGLEVFVFNDGNAACWAELAAIEPPRPNNFAYLHVGTFVGAGIIAEGRLWEGPTGNSANLGAMLVTDTRGRQAFVHTLASIFAFRERLRGNGIELPNGDPYFWDWETFEPHLSDWLNEAGWALALAIANTTAVIELGLAIIDEVVPEAILQRLVDRVNFHSSKLPLLTSGPVDIHIGRAGRMAPAKGAALLPIYRRFFDPD